MNNMQTDQNISKNNSNSNISQNNISKQIQNSEQDEDNISSINNNKDIDDINDSNHNDLFENNDELDMSSNDEDKLSKQYINVFKMFNKSILATISHVLEVIPEISHFYVIIKTLDFQDSTAILYGSIFTLIFFNLVMLPIRTRIEIIVSYSYKNKNIIIQNYSYLINENNNDNNDVQNQNQINNEQNNENNVNTSNDQNNNDTDDQNNNVNNDANIQNNYDNGNINDENNNNEEINQQNNNTNQQNLNQQIQQQNIQNFSQFLNQSEFIDQNLIQIPSLMFQRSNLIYIVLFLTVILPIMLFSGFILPFILEKYLAKATSIYIQLLIVPIFFKGLFCILRSYLYAIDQYWFPCLVQVVAVLFLLFDDIIVYRYRLQGAAFSHLVVWFFSYIGLVIICYFVYQQKKKYRMFNFDPAAFNGWLRYLFSGSYLGYGIFIDFLAMNIISSVFVNLLENQNEQRVYQIFDRIRQIYTMINTAFSIVVTNSTSTLISKNQLKACYKNLISTLILMSILTCLELFPFMFEKEITKLVIFNENDLIVFQDYLIYFLVINVIQNFLEALAAYLRAIGQEFMQFYAYLFIHPFITIPMAYYLGFKLKMGIHGIIISLIAGQGLILIIFIYDCFSSILQDQYIKIIDIIQEEKQDCIEQDKK